MTDVLETPVLEPAGAIPAPPYRVLRVVTPAMLDAYRQEWASAVKDFHRRTWRPRRRHGRPYFDEPPLADVETALRRLADRSDAGLWLGLTGSWRLLGFAGATLGTDLWGRRTAMIQAAYLWPRRPNWQVLPALVDAMTTWAQTHGAWLLAFETRRNHPRAWARQGFTRTEHRFWVREL